MLKGTLLLKREEHLEKLKMTAGTLSGNTHYGSDPHQNHTEPQIYKHWECFLTYQSTLV